MTNWARNKAKYLRDKIFIHGGGGIMETYHPTHNSKLSPICACSLLEYSVVGMNFMICSTSTINPKQEFLDQQTKFILLVNRCFLNSRNCNSEEA